MPNSISISIFHQQELKLNTGVGVRVRTGRATVGICGSSLWWPASHCPSLSLQCQQFQRYLCQKKNKAFGCSLAQSLERTVWCQKLVSCLVWNSQGLTKSLSSIKGHCITRWQLEPLLLPSTTVYVFSDNFHRSACLCFSYLSPTDRKYSIPSSPAKNFSLFSAELAVPPSLALS